MKRRDPELVGDLIRRAVEAAGNTDQFDTQKALYLWAEVVGPGINRLTTARYMVRDELHVVIASGPLKTELAFMADSIIRRINDLTGRPLVRRLIIH